MKLAKCLLFILALISLSAFNPPQPADERKKQEALPQASSDMWDKLATAKIDFDEKASLFRAIVPVDVKALSGKDVTINGFILPLETSTKYTHFLLSKRTPTCPYCMPGGPTEVFDVYMKEPIAYTDGVIFVTGKFKFIDDSKSGLYFRLVDSSAKIEEPMYKTKSILNQPPV